MGIPMKLVGIHMILVGILIKFVGIPIKLVSIPMKLMGIPMGEIIEFGQKSNLNSFFLLIDSSYFTTHT